MHQTLEMTARLTARCVDVAVVIHPITLAAKRSAGSAGTACCSAATSLGGLACQRLCGVGHPGVVDHRFLHRHFDALTSAGVLALIQRGEDANRGVKTGARVTDIWTWF